LSTIIHGIQIARCIFKRIRNFLTYRIAATLQLLVFFFIAVFVFKPAEFEPSNWKEMNAHGLFPDKVVWPPFFHMPVLMLMLITLLNDGTLIAIGYDHVQPRESPEKWNLPVLFLVSSVLAGVACISSLLILGLSLDSWTPHHLYQNWGIGGLSYGQVTTTIYLKVSVSDFLTLFSARTGENFFWTTAPAPILLGAGAVALSASTIIACSWPASYPDHIYALGLARRQPYGLPAMIWLYCIVWWFIQDAAKVGAYFIIRKYNLFHYNDTGEYVMPESVAKYIKENKDKDMAGSSGKSKH